MYNMYIFMCVTLVPNLHVSTYHFLLRVATCFTTIIVSIIQLRTDYMIYNTQQSSLILIPNHVIYLYENKKLYFSFRE